MINCTSTNLFFVLSILSAGLALQGSEILKETFGGENLNNYYLIAILSMWYYLYRFVNMKHKAVTNFQRPKQKKQNSVAILI